MNDVKSPVRITGCKREDCPVNSGGACAQDFENIEECNEVILVAANQPLPQEEFKTIKLGMALNLEDVATLLQDREIKTSCIIGSPSSGKTTFIGTLFHRFMMCADGFNGHRYMDSETFLSLNEKLFYTIMRINNSVVNMPRSTTEDDNWGFHIKTKLKDNSTQEIVLIDVPGEAMEQQLSKGVGNWSKFKSLGRATHLILFLDLEIISNRQSSGPYIAKALDTLMNSIQSKVWNKQHKLMVVFSKADAFGPGLSSEINDTKKSITNRFGSDFRSIDFCELYCLGNDVDADKSLSMIWNWIRS